jgi:hypothetical protein
MYVVFVFLSLRCGLMQPDKVKAFVPGVYVRHYTDEYTDSYDTITIRAVNDKYEVIKKTKFEKVMNNGGTAPGYTIQRWTGNYDDKTKSLWLEQAGKAISFNPAKKELIIGTQPYKKL